MARTKRTTLLAKLGVTYGTDAVPTGSANAMLAFDVQAEPMELDEEERMLVRPYFGARDNLIGAAWKALQFSVEAAGSGAAGTAPKFGPLLRMCGLGETVTADTDVTYKPVSASEEWCDIYANLDGENNKVLGCRGTWGLHFVARRRPFYRFSALGLYQAIADASLPSMDWTDWQKPLPVNNTNSSAFSLHGYSAKLAELHIEGGVEFGYDNLVGSERITITDRKVSGNVLIERPTVAQKDYYANVKAGTTGALSLLHGTAGGNKLQVDAATVQLGKPTREDRGGVAFLRIPFLCIPSEAGNDDVSLKHF